MRETNFLANRLLSKVLFDQMWVILVKRVISRRRKHGGTDIVSRLSALCVFCRKFKIHRRLFPIAYQLTCHSLVTPNQINQMTTTATKEDTVSSRWLSRKNKVFFSLFRAERQWQSLNPSLIDSTICALIWERIIRRRTDGTIAKYP